MALEIRLTPLALRDLAGIHDWTWNKFGFLQADRYVSDLASLFKLVAENPGLARSANETRKDLFKCGSGSHVVFFRVSKRTLTVVRILHGGMDFNRWL